MHPTCILSTNQYWLDYYTNNIHISKLVSNYHVKNLFLIEPKVKCFQIPTLKQMKNACIPVNFLILELVSSHMHLMHQTLIALHKLATCSSHLAITRKTWFPLVGSSRHLQTCCKHSNLYHLNYALFQVL
jgi:hypothetical protein